MSQPLLEVRDSTKHFEVRAGFLRRSKEIVRAVDGVSLDLSPGETLGIVGESGCGKSTLARVLLYLQPPTAGVIRFDGHDVDQAHVGWLRRRAQMVFQDPYTSLPPRMKVHNIIADPMKIHGLGSAAERNERVRLLLREVGLDPRRSNQYPYQFSGGQRQRIGIARALAIEPELLVLDEAVSALDVSVQAQVLNLLRDLQDRHGFACIFISHDLSVVRYMSDTIAVMYLGKIVEQGTAEEVYSNPLHPYTQSLLSAVPMLNRKRHDRILLTGEPPKPTNPPSGCAFHPRCPIAQPLCSETTPLLQEWVPARVSACHFAGELAVQAGLTGARGSEKSSELVIR